MEEKGSPPVEGSEEEYHEFTEQNDDDCDPDLSKNL